MVAATWGFAGPGPRERVGRRIAPRVDEDEAVARGGGLVPAEHAHLIGVRLRIQVADEDDGIAGLVERDESLHESADLSAADT